MKEDAVLRVIPGFIILTPAVIELYDLAPMSRATSNGLSVVHSCQETLIGV